MITQLSITNYILIEALEVPFHRGLNIVTGETGAGKSILMGALSLLAGERADPKAMRNPEVRCVVEAWFKGDFPELNTVLSEAGIDPEPETILRREILPGGKSRAFLNDSPVTLDLMKKASLLLFDIHGQQDTLLLGQPERQIQILDLLAGTQNPLQAYKTAYHDWKAATRKHKELEEKRDRETSELSYKQFVFNELEEAAIRPGEQEELENKLRILKNSEEIELRIQQALEVVDGPADIAGQLKSVAHQLEKLGNYAPALQEIAARLKSSYLEIQDLAGEIRDQEDRFQHDPAIQEATEERLSQLYHLQKKHRKDSEGQLLAFRDQLLQDLEGFSNLDEEILKLQKEASRKEEEMVLQANRLREARLAATPKLEKELVALLQDMGIPHARFEIQMEAAAPGPMGADAIRFLFSANPGLPPADLKNAASGGEFSRLMLAFKCLMARSAEMPCLVFDEIDTGISGEVAMKVGRLMKELSGRHQVLTITHSAQMASRADAHWFVYKNQETSRTTTQVRLLTDAEHLQEIAKMISGTQLTNGAIQAARDLIQS